MSWLLERIHQFDGEKAGLVCQDVGAAPVWNFAGLPRLGEKALDFFHHVVLNVV